MASCPRHARLPEAYEQCRYHHQGIEPVERYLVLKRVSRVDNKETRMQRLDFFHLGV